MLRTLILILIGKYALFISRLWARFLGHRAVCQILHLLCPDLLVRWINRLALSTPGFDMEEAKQGGLHEAEKVAELMPDEVLSKIADRIRDGTIGEKLDTMFASYPMLKQMGVTEAEFTEIFEREKFLREHRERHRKEG